MTRQLRFSLTTAEACALLRLSDKTLRRLRAAQVLRPGIHFLTVGAGTIRPDLRWDPVALEEALALRSRKVLR